MKTVRAQIHALAIDETIQIEIVILIKTLLKLTDNDRSIISFVGHAKKDQITVILVIDEIYYDTIQCQTIAKAIPEWLELRERNATIECSVIAKNLQVATFHLPLPVAA